MFSAVYFRWLSIMNGSLFLDEVLWVSPKCVQGGGQLRLARDRDGCTRRQKHGRSKRALCWSAAHASHRHHASSM